MTDTVKKRKQLRHNEYYFIQNEFDKLYKDSINNKKHKDLIKLITDERNIKLAFRNIKKNSGSSTSGTDNQTIAEFKNMDSKEYIKLVQTSLKNYQPSSIRRVYIPKPNGDKRPLGIPTMKDRLIQQCIKQVLEPICEAKFHKHSYGFRPNRNTSHAVSRMYSLAQRFNFKYCVDIDIKGFFDNVNHSKLIKQMWTLGIQDKNLISIISKMLKAEVQGEGISNKGTPQGGILSPLLSNIVLNELDWWLSSQWETFESDYKYYDTNKRYTMLTKNSNLKKFFFIRYADDFKIMCKDIKTAKKIFIAVKSWLKDRLGLEISEEKSKIINLTKSYSNFLGIKIKLRKKNNSYTVKSHICDKAKQNIKEKLRFQLEWVRRFKTFNEINKLNSIILGVHKYYAMATHVNKDFSDIGYYFNKTLSCRTKNFRSFKGQKSETFKLYYGKYNFRTIFLKGIAIFPVQGITTKPPTNFSQDINNYTVKGRKKIHSKLQNVKLNVMKFIMENPILSRSQEFNDNRISVYTVQNGCCKISKLPLEVGNMVVHHVKPTEKGGEDNFQNLIYVTKEIHYCIHAKYEETFNKWLMQIQFQMEEIGETNFEKVRKAILKYRKLAENFELIA